MSFLNPAGIFDGFVDTASDAAAYAGKAINDVNTNEFNADYLKPPADLQGTLQQWSLTGQGPSAAQGLIAAERAKNISAAQSMAKSQPGLTLGAQQRLATMGSAQANAGAARAGAEMRAKEQQSALQGYQDLYKTQAQAYADAMRANAQVAAENTAADRSLMGGVFNTIGGVFGL